MILSWHDFKKTPSLKELRILLEEMKKRGADIAKIVSFARSLEDNLKLLSLIPYGRERSLETIAFCMGDMGKMSRIFSLLFGAPWTYASMDKSHLSAPGQLTVKEIKDLWRHLR
ncbi:MAG: type I 3-dehydroquinate dehydratase [Thermodesulfobacteriota bacterium]